MRRKSLYPAPGTAVHFSNPAVAGTLARMLFNNFFHNYSLPLNKNQFPTYFHFTFSPVTLIKAGFVAFKHITFSLHDFHLTQNIIHLYQKLINFLNFLINI